MGFEVGIAIDRASNVAVTATTKRKRLAIVGKNQVKKFVDGLEEKSVRLVLHHRFYILIVGVVNEWH